MPLSAPEWASLSFVSPAVYAPAAVVAWLLAWWLVKRVVFRRLHAWAAKTSVDWDDLLVESLSFPLNFTILASGLGLLVELLPMPARVDRIVTLAFQGSVIFAVVLFVDGLLLGLMRRKSSPIFSVVSQGVVKGLVRGFVMGLGALIFLDQIGISITPILASLGIGSLAVALALQDTLSNFFAGLYVAIDKPVKEGDFVRLETGEEGYVVEVGWRSTRVRTLPNNVIILPNKKLMESVITNYHLPDKEIAVLVQMGVHYESDLPRVERTAIEVAREVLSRVPGGVPGFEPIVRFHTFGESSVDFTVVLRAGEFSDNFLVKHEFIKAVHERFRKEGIVIPYPIRTLELSASSAALFGGPARRA